MQVELLLGVVLQEVCWGSETQEPLTPAHFLAGKKETEERDQPIEDAPAFHRAHEADHASGGKEDDGRPFDCKNVSKCFVDVTPAMGQELQSQVLR